MDKNLTQTLASLAILRVDINQRRTDYLGYLVPFVREILAPRAGGHVDDQAVTSEMLDRYGLKIPVATVHLVLKRLARSGVLQRNHGSYHVSSTIAGDGLEERRETAANTISRVINQLKAFAQATFGKQWDDSKTTVAVVSFLGKFSIECLRTFEQGTALPELEDDKLSEIYIVSRFLKKSHTENPELFRDFMVLVKGSMLANALLCPDLESIAKNFRRVTFFMDTSLLLSLMGLEDAASQAATQELVRLVKALDGEVAVFIHTLDELQGVVAAAANQVDSASTTMRAARAARRQGLKPSDLLMMAESVESLVSDLGVATRPTPRATFEFQISEPGLQVAIEQEAHYGNPRALEYDINSIRSIYELRGGFQPRRLEDARTVLLTSNTALARAAFEFGKRHSPGAAVSTVVTDFSLANIAWLKAPAEMPDLPEREVLAACYAALEPTPATWTRYLAEIDRLERTGKISAEEHQVLRYSSVAQEGLADLTIGRDRALTGADVDELMSRVKRDMSREAEERRAEALRALYLERSRSQRMEEDARRIRARVGSFGLWIGEIARVLLLLAAAGLSFLLSVVANGLLAIVYPHFAGIPALVVITSVLTAVFWAFDLTPKGFANRSGKYVREKATDLMTRWLSLPSEKPVDDAQASIPSSERPVGKKQLG